MSKEQRLPLEMAKEALLLPGSGLAGYAACELDEEGHCITCSDEAVSVRVLRIDQEGGVALVSVKDATKDATKDVTEEVDISLVDDVVAGDTLLVHGGVAISRLDEARDA